MHRIHRISGSRSEAFTCKLLFRSLHGYNPSAFSFNKTSATLISNARTMRPAILLRRAILLLACIGIIVGLFWDTLFAHIHGEPGASGSAEAGECPYVSLTGVSSSQAGGGGDKQVKATDVVHLLDEEAVKAGEKVVVDESLLVTLTTQELGFYDGSNAALPILVCIDDLVFDVSEASEKYGRSKGYSSFAGKVATRAMALSSLEASDMTNDLSDLGEAQIAVKNKWRSFFLHKYPVVAKIKLGPTTGKQLVYIEPIQLDLTSMQELGKGSWILSLFLKTCFRSVKIRII